MSFQGYLDAIKTKTGKTPADFRAHAAKMGWTAGGTLAPGVKPGRDHRRPQSNVRARTRSCDGDHGAAEGIEERR